MTDSRVLITHENPKSPISEAYRMLRTNILFSNLDRPLKSFAVTSFNVGEGKTTTVANLAVIFSQQGSRVLVIDGDLRKPVIHRIFGFENVNGLTDILLKHDDYVKYIKRSQIDNLDVLVCGTIPPNPSELLLSRAMRNLLQQVRDYYDIVLIDAPPVGIVTDAAIASTMADGVILVAAAGKITVGELLRAKEILKKVNANIIGVILNKINRKSSGYYNNHYYG